MTDNPFEGLTIEEIDELELAEQKEDAGQSLALNQKTLANYIDKQLTEGLRGRKRTIREEGIFMAYRRGLDYSGQERWCMHLEAPGEHMIVGTEWIKDDSDGALGRLVQRGMIYAQHLGMPFRLEIED